MTRLSIVIVSFNTKAFLKDCLESLYKHKNEVPFEIIVSDNGSIDGSIEYLQEVEDKYNLKLVLNEDNLGFSKGNNVAKGIAKGEYVLFLNPDTVVHKGVLSTTVNYMQENKDVGAVTCKIVLPSGDLDLDARRSFPTPWVALTHFAALDRLFPTSHLFAQYWYGYKSANETHEVEVLQGAYFLTRREILDKVGWFSEEYFLDGEDIDLSWKVKNAGFKLIYLPTTSITHIKKASKKGKRSMRSILAGVTSMEIFYRKRLSRNYSFVTNLLVLTAIKILRFVRMIKYYVLSFKYLVFGL